MYVAVVSGMLVRERRRHVDDTVYQFSEFQCRHLLPTVEKLVESQPVPGVEQERIHVDQVCHTDVPLGSV
jgi:hypothetical protein